MLQCGGSYAGIYEKCGGKCGFKRRPLIPPCNPPPEKKYLGVCMCLLCTGAWNLSHPFDSLLKKNRVGLSNREQPLIFLEGLGIRSLLQCGRCVFKGARRGPFACGVFSITLWEFVGYSRNVTQCEYETFLRSCWAKRENWKVRSMRRAFSPPLGSVIWTLLGKRALFTYLMGCIPTLWTGKWK